MELVSHIYLNSYPVVLNDLLVLKTLLQEKIKKTLHNQSPHHTGNSILELLGIYHGDEA